jgi:Flp pilus assembly protein TadB
MASLMSITLLAAVLIALAAGTGLLIILSALRPASPLRPLTPLARLRTSIAGPLLGLRLIGGVGAGIGVLLLTRWPVAAAAITVLVVFWPGLFGATVSSRDRVTQLEALAMWTESLKDLVSGATGLHEAIPASMATAPAVLSKPLHRLSGLIGAREPLPTALRQLAEDLADPSADLVIAALVMNAETRGPGLAASLDRLACSIREELELRRSIEASRRGGRRSVQIMSVAVAVMACLMAFVLPPQFTAPYRTPAGQLVLLIVFAIFTGCFLMLRRLGDPDIPDTFLSDAAGRR